MSTTLNVPNDEMMVYREQLGIMLQKGICTLTYRKEDGSIREATGTLSGSLIPESKHPKGNRAIPEDSPNQTYYDLNSDGWRSFNVNRLEKISLEGVGA